MKNHKKILYVIIAIIVAILIISLTIFFLNNKKIVQDEIIAISDYQYFVLYNSSENVGVIDRDGNIVIEPKYSDIYIPNPLKPVFICFDGEESSVINLEGEKIFQEYTEVSALITSESSLLELEKSVLRYKKDDLYGLISLDGEVITEPIYEEISSLTNRPGRILVKKDDLYGVLDSKGNIVVPISYYSIIGDEYCDEDDGYTDTGYIVSNKTSNGIMYGYYNAKGRKVLDTKYESISRVLEYNDDDVYLIAMSNGKKGVLKNGRKIIDLNYQDVIYSRLSEIFIVNKNGKYGFFEKNGREILEPKYESYQIAGDYISVTEEGNKLLYDINGNYIDQKNYSSIIEVENSSYFIAIDEQNGNYSIISKDVNIENNYKNISYLFDSLFAFTNEEGKSGIIDANKGEILEAKYDIILPIEGINAIEARDIDGTATIYSKNMQEICTMSGAIVENINENFAVVYNQTERIYLDKNGEKVENTVVYLSLPMYAISQNGKWGYADKNGNIILEAQYDMVTEINEYGFAGINKDGKWGVVDKEGKIIVEPTYQIESYYFPKFIGKYLYEQTETIHCIDLEEN